MRCSHVVAIIPVSQKASKRSQDKRYPKGNPARLRNKAWSPSVPGVGPRQPLLFQNLYFRSIVENVMSFFFSEIARSCTGAAKAKPPKNVPGVYHAGPPSIRTRPQSRSPGVVAIFRGAFAAPPLVCVRVLAFSRFFARMCLLY